MKILGAAAVIRDDRGLVLLVKHSYGKLNWELPGGHAEAGESIAETAVREVREETGLHVAAQRLTGIYYAPGNDSHHFVFACTREDPEILPASISEETTDCGFFDPNDLPRPISNWTVRRINDAISCVAVEVPVLIKSLQWLE